MPPELKSSTTHSKPGQYTSTETDWGNRTPTPTYTVQDKTNTGQTCTGQQNKVKDAGTRISKIAKNTLKCHKKQINLNAHSLKWALKLKAKKTQARRKEKGKTVTTRLRGKPHQLSPRYHWHTTDAGSNVCDERSGSV